MRLKRVELQGFKSFADAAQIEIAPGLTAIVGPNGCGKSNIVDAIRWVLGEQSWKTLRGNRLEDAIFAGSAGRRALSFAEVRLAIENDDGALPVAFHDVTVARKGFRSGESRAYINRTECRLRDVHELFLDTGLGGGAFAVVGQGEIDHILSAKPDELRTWLEETAGISKVRTKRKEALKRLEETDQDLVRIEDLKAEGERRLAPLVQEAERAEAYESLRREAKLLETLLVSGRYRMLALEGATRLERAGRRAEQRDEAKRALEQAARRREELSRANGALDRQLQEAADRRSSDDRTVADIRQQVALAEQERSHAASERERLRGTRVAAGARTAKLANEVTDLAEQLAAAEREVEKWRDALGRLEKRRAEEGLAALEGRLAGHRERLLIAVRERSGAEARVVGIRERITSFASADDQLEEAFRAAEEREAEARQAADREAQALEEVRARAARLRQEREELQRSVREELAPERKRAAAKLQSVQETVQSARARRSALEEMERSRQGYAQGVKRVLDDREALGGGICGVVADLIRVDERWETAVETALGGALQQVVVESEQDAKSAIEYLRKVRGGRATFLPLDTLTPRPPSREAMSAVEGDPGAVGAAAELVRVDPKYKVAVDYLLGRTVVVYDIEAGLRLSKRLRGTGVSRVVTESGDLLIPGGAITGGEAARRGAGEAWARRREQAKLSEDIAALTSELEAARAEHDELESAIEQEEASIRRVEAELQQLEGARSDALEQVQRANRELATAAAALRRAADELDRARDADVQAREELDVALSELAERVERENEAERAVASAEEEVGAAKARAESTAGEVGELKMAFARKEAERDRARDSLEERRREVERAARADAEDAARLQALDERLEQLDARVDQLRRRLEELERESGAAAEEYERLREERRSVGQALADASEAEARRRAELAETEREVQRLQLEEAEWEGRKARLRDRLDDLGPSEALWERLRAADGGWSAVVHEAAAAAEQSAKDGELGRPESADPADSTDSAAKFRPPLMWPELSANPPAPESDSWARWERECEAALRNLRLRMSSMGAVNPNAGSELHEERSRLSFLTAQRDDLIQAKQSILEAVDEIDQTAEQKLLETYGQVRAAFAELFAKLFDGGKADLTFVDPDRPLESGMEVKAQPPGKRTQNLVALSGGERTMSAIALLFAAFQVKPSPFCVLDEIDAALDEANLDRFAGLLREFAGKAQFIVITHRPRTMEEADNLYGVTMEESGVSKLVSVRLGTIGQPA